MSSLQGQMLNARPKMTLTTRMYMGTVAVHLLVLKGILCKEHEEYGLTAPELGGTTFPDSVTVHPLGRPEMDVVAVPMEVTTDAVAVPYHGQPVRVAGTEEE